MKIDHLAGTQLPIQKAAGALSFAGDGDFASKLTLGQIIKGRVLRSYEGGRYLVDFSGQQKVVDSAVPLRTDEVIVGRVVGLSERVELQRINTPSVSPETTTAANAAGGGATGAAATLPTGDTLDATLARLQSATDAATAELVQKVAQRSGQPATMAKAALLLSRIGLPLSQEALRLVYDALQRDPSRAMFALPDHGVELATTAASGMPPAAAATAQAALATPQSLGTALAELLNDLPEARRPQVAAGDPRRRPDGGDASAGGADDSGSDDGRRGGLAALGAPDRPGYDGQDLARRILNVQSGGAVAHRVGTLPLLVDGRLHELNVALFEEAASAHDARNPNGPKAKSASAHRHRQVVFAVTTETLGTVEVRASAAGSNLRVAIGADSRAASESLARHAPELASTLGALGWSVDELAYRTTTTGDGLVGRTILEHLVSPGSVSTLA